MKIGIIADTATDTAMGERFFRMHGYETVCRPVKEDSKSCFQFFQESQEVRDAYVTGLIGEVKADGAEVIAVYANSVCAYVDFGKLAELTGTKIITPFDAYGEIAARYSRPAVWSVTAAALCAIEKRMLETNPDVQICGIYKLGIAVLIENGCSPEEVVEKASLRKLMDFCEGSGSDCIVLGCTHFPYLMKELSQYTQIPIIDSAEIMLQTISNLEV